MLVILLACEPEIADSREARELVGSPPLVCTQGTAVAVEPVLSTAETNLIVVPLLTTDGAAANALISWSPAGTQAWTEGAPVVVTLPPAHKVDQTWAVHPTVWYGPDVGVVEVQPVWPGWVVQGTASGTFDAGGADSTAVFDAVLAFATGGVDADGHLLADYVQSPVCTSAVALLSLSSAGMPALEGLATYGATYDEKLVGLTLYEPPSLPEFVVAESGAIWMDPDPKVDADADGLVWNDGRNLSLNEASCSVSGCAVDYASLAWTPDLALSDLWEGYDTALPAGLFYFDRDTSGSLDLNAEGYTDSDGDGAIDIGEDTYTRPLVLGSGPAVKVYYTPAMTRAAESLPLPRWPPFVATSAESDTFWPARDMAVWAAPAAAALPDAMFSVVYTTVPHGPALATRPAERILHDAFVEAGVTAAYNFTVAAAQCFDPDTFADYPEPPPGGTIVAPEAMADWAVLEGYGAANIQPVGPLDQLQARFGAFDHCGAGG